MNEVIKVLTVVATIFTPPTFFASVYGMNFAWMPEIHGGLAWPWSTRSGSGRLHRHGGGHAHLVQAARMAVGRVLASRSLHRIMAALVRPGGSPRSCGPRLTAGVSLR